jgi:hypothetical protein
MSGDRHFTVSYSGTVEVWLTPDDYEGLDDNELRWKVEEYAEDELPDDAEVTDIDEQVFVQRQVPVPFPQRAPLTPSVSAKARKGVDK